MRAPRGLSPEERAAWTRLARTVTPLHPEPPKVKETPTPAAQATIAPLPPRRKAAAAHPTIAASPPKPEPIQRTGGLDSSWERKLKGARLEPDFTLDLHGHTLDGAHARLESGLAQAKALGARLVLVITGKPRPVEHADRGERRGAIRAKVLDWLAAGSHSADIAAVRGAHRRHGGDGALYIVLKRGR
mgnify:CR=1 FL=1